MIFNTMVHSKFSLFLYISFSHSFFLFLIFFLFSLFFLSFFLFLFLSFYLHLFFLQLHSLIYFLKSLANVSATIRGKTTVASA